MNQPSPINRMKRTALAGAITAGLLGGGAAGILLTSGGVSGAQETTTTIEQPAPGQDSERPDRPDPSARLGEVLAPLVEDGTINQAQADAVIAALIEAGPRGGGGHGRPHDGPHGGGLRRGLDAAAGALGISAEELLTALRDGSTIAQVAEERGVEVQTVIDAMVAELESHLAEEVASGEHTQEQADEMLQRATERITDLVNNGRPERGGPGRDRD
jgi:hypothetical protein